MHGTLLWAAEASGSGDAPLVFGVLDGEAAAFEILEIEEVDCILGGLGGFEFDVAEPVGIVNTYRQYFPRDGNWKIGYRGTQTLCLILGHP